MSKEFNHNQPHFWIRLGCKEEQNPPLLQDIYTFMHDFNLIYEISRAVTDPNYDFPFLDLLSYRGEDGLYFHLRDEDRLRVERVNKESPLELITIVAAVPAAVGAIWGVVQIVEKLANFRLNRRKLKEEVRKLEIENASNRDPSQEPPDASFLFENRHFFESRLEERGAIEVYRRAGERLVRSRIEIVEVQIEIRGVNQRTNAI